MVQYERSVACLGFANCPDNHVGNDNGWLARAIITIINIIIISFRCCQFKCKFCKLSKILVRAFNAHSKGNNHRHQLLHPEISHCMVDDLATHLQIYKLCHVFVWRCNIQLVSQLKLSEILVVHLCLEKIFVVLLENV